MDHVISLQVRVPWTLPGWTKWSLLLRMCTTVRTLDPLYSPLPPSRSLTCIFRLVATLTLSTYCAQTANFWWGAILTLGQTRGPFWNLSKTSHILSHMHQPFVIHPLLQLLKWILFSSPQTMLKPASSPGTATTWTMMRRPYCFGTVYLAILAYARLDGLWSSNLNTVYRSKCLQGPSSARSAPYAKQQGLPPWVPVTGLQIYYPW